MRKAGIAALVLAAALLAGCDGMQRPVSGGASPSASSGPNPSEIAARPTPSPSPANTPVPRPTSPAPYVFPMGAAGLFGGAEPPEGFFCPLWLDAKGGSFLHSTPDGRIVEERWNGVLYEAVPVAEGVDTSLGAAVFPDGQGNLLCCAGTKIFPGNRPGPAIVVVDKAAGKRGNADELCGWKEANRALSSKFQFDNGLILAQVLEYRDAEYVPLNRWALLAVEGRSSFVLNMERFLERNLPDWQELLSMRLAMTGEGHLLAACLVRRVDAESGAEEHACIAVEMDMKGNATDFKKVVSEGKKPQECAISGASHFSASPDGKYLLYTDSTGLGIFLYDRAAGVEYTILGGGSSARAFAQWGGGGVIYWGAAGQQGRGDVFVYRTNVGEIIKPS
jgi:hypothetical protein